MVKTQNEFLNGIYMFHQFRKVSYLTQFGRAIQLEFLKSNQLESERMID
jgi:hypothetical protein